MEKVVWDIKFALPLEKKKPGVPATVTDFDKTGHEQFLTSGFARYKSCCYAIVAGK